MIDVASDSSSGSAGNTGDAEQRVLIASGPDHPGVLDDISSAVADAGCQINRVRVANLSGWFAVLILIDGGSGGFDGLADRLPGIADRHGVQTQLRNVAGEVAASKCMRFELDLSRPSGGSADAADESETLTRLSNLLRVMNVNIADIDQRRPQPGDAFELHLDLDVPRDVPVGRMRQLVGQLADGIGVTWHLHSARDVAE